MIEVKLLHKQPNEVVEIVRELRRMGWQQGADFDYIFYPARYNNDGHEAVAPRQTKFLFYNEKYATIFVIKFM